MNYVELNNIVKMPILGFGTFLLNGEECIKAVTKAIEVGYRMIDTAEAYGNEREVGDAIKKSGVPRDELFLVTKLNFKSYENAKETIVSSMEKLQTDYIDLVLLHWPFANYYAAWRELESMYIDGSIRAIGISNFEPSQMIDLIAYNQVIPVVNQIETNLYCQRLGEREWLKRERVAHMAYAPLGQGNRNEMFKEELVTKIAEKYNKTPVQVLLHFLTQQGIITIPRSSNIGRIKENFDIFDFNLTDAELEALKKLDQDIALVGNSQKPELVEQSLSW